MAAIALLPRRPARIEVIDAMQNQPAVRDYLLTLDAFITKGEDVVYLVQQSAVLQGARAGSGLFRAMLASVIWHEMAHLGGSDEGAARQAEESIWKRFVRDGLTDQITGLRYLDALRKRPDDQLMAVR